ncbi:MAG: DUF1080 domain-containing protein [Planctomycetes bacterium]|nr:DUF1080 domain-containing protein [Planctomycetota bacterium]
MLSLRLFVACAFVGATLSLLPAEDKKPAAPAGDDGFKPLFDGKTLDGWTNVNCHPDTFFVKNGEIVTTGEPTGFLRSAKQYENFVLEFEWMHVEKVKMANSGLFVWGDPLPGVGTPYTRGIEVQVLINFAPKDGWATSHGDIFSIHGARCKPDRVHPVNPKMERCLPSENRVKGGGEWNHYKVTANDGTIKLAVNGKEVSGVSQSNPRKGYLALESEGAECHFKNIKIKELPSTNPKPAEIANEWEGHTSIFNGIDPTGWKAEKDAWKVGGGKFVCTGKGQLTTEKRYGPVELVLDWKLPAKGAENCYLNFADAGFTFAPNEYGADYDPALWAEVEKDKAKNPGVKFGTWNRTVVRFDGKKLTLTVNGVLAATLEAKKAINPGTLVIGSAQTTKSQGLEIMNVFVRELKDK